MVRQGGGEVAPAVGFEHDRIELVMQAANHTISGVRGVCNPAASESQRREMLRFSGD